MHLFFCLGCFVVVGRGDARFAQQCREARVCSPRLRDAVPIKYPNFHKNRNSNNCTNLNLDVYIPEGENKYLTNTAQNYRMNLNMITNLTISECGDVVCWRGDARLVQQRREARVCYLCRHEAAPINK